jgi:hypothetical protein
MDSQDKLMRGPWGKVLFAFTRVFKFVFRIK